jgi:hypothetical protein
MIKRYGFVDWEAFDEKDNGLYVLYTDHLAAITEKDREIERTKSDCMTLTLRLYGEPLGSMSPETIEVMGRWKPLAAELIGDCPHDL